MQLVEISDRTAWDTYVGGHAQGHPLQLWGWGEAKRANNWTPYRLALVEGEEWKAAAQVLLWPIPRLGKRIAYVPRGPVVDPASPEAARLLEALVAWAKQHRVLYVRVEPAWLKAKLPEGWRRAGNTLQMNETYTIDLAKSEEQLLEPMIRKHRQYIRKAGRDGVAVERQTGGDLAAMYEIYTQTAQRAGFGIHTEEYYAGLFKELGEHNFLYYARVEGRPVAFLWLVATGPVAYELYGGVTPEGQDIKANYLLKWHAITEMKAQGRQVYDFNGRVSEGVSQFKAGFGPDETDYMGTWDYPLSLVGYHLWERLWPMAKPVGRLIGRRR
ncbi:MAG: methicillin resistance protein [Patescibacteria group bacterium]|nr:methicillin resistance protein [Patescibacteria group bacterium]